MHKQNTVKTLPKPRKPPLKSGINLHELDVAFLTVENNT